MSACQHCGGQHPPGSVTCPRSGDAMSLPGAIGTRVDRYHLEALLGTGGFGAVYRARHVHTDARVALKVLKRALGADPVMVERFLREAKAAAAVGSDHIVRVLDAGHDAQGAPFLALELLDGVDLQGLAQREGRLSPERVVALCRQVLEGLEAAHQKGIVHRDMKPANAFVTRKVDEHGAEREFVKLLDFGISKMHADGNPKTGLTMTGMAMGTPSYMAPEQFFDARSVDARADLYSVAAMLYELLGGRLPLEASSYADLIVRVRTEAPAHLSLVVPGLPLALADAVMVGLAKEKEHRWPSARAFSNALRDAMGAPGAGPRPAGDTPSTMLGSTATPARLAAPLAGGKVTPAQTGAPRLTAPSHEASAPPPSSGAGPIRDAQGPDARAAAPAPGAPSGSGGAGGPPGAAPAVAPSGPRGLAPRGAMKWVLVVGAVLVVSCCGCLGLTMLLGHPSEGHPKPAADTRTPTDIRGVALEPVDVPLPGPTTDAADAPSRAPALTPEVAPEPAADDEPLDASVTAVEPTTDEVEVPAPAAGADPGDGAPPAPVAEFPAADDLPSLEAFTQALDARGEKPGSPAYVEKLRAFERLVVLTRKRDEGSLTPDEEREGTALLKTLGDF
ncbi:MAG: protein kinase [Myxococcaceae bacterium]|nr:protein kinase [Myxococcaceae bacterium]